MRSQFTATFPFHHMVAVNAATLQVATDPRHLGWDGWRSLSDGGGSQDPVELVRHRPLDG